MNLSSVGQKFFGVLWLSKIKFFCVNSKRFVKNEISWKHCEFLKSQQKGIFRLKQSRDYFNCNNLLPGVCDDKFKLHRLIIEIEI